MADLLPHTLADLDALVSQQVQESLHLDYKASAALTNRDEISKDVSAFLNSDGGRIIYGMVEKNHLPERVDSGVNHSAFSRERLEQIFLSNIAPRPSGIEVVAIPLSSSHSVYAVGIPRSLRGPHQDSRTKKYYKRFEFQSVPMEHFEIEDVRTRRALLEPLLSVDVEIHQGILVELAFENIGSYPALEVSFSIDPPIELEAGKDLPLLTRGTAYFPPRRRYLFLYGSYIDLMASGNTKPTAFAITVTYRHALSEDLIQDVFQFDLKDYLSSSIIRSDVLRASAETTDAIKALTQELQKVRQGVEGIGAIAGATGLTLSMPTIENLKGITEGSLDHPRADCRHWTPNALMEALGVPRDMAQAIYAKTYRGDLSQLDSVPGITPELVAGVRRLFE
jgi:hypothetical protein